MKQKKSPFHSPSEAQQGLLEQVRVVLVTAAVDAQDRWVALLLFSAAAKHLKHRDQWIGWTRPQCDRRLSLVVNNSRFLILPDRSVPNLGSRVLRLALDRLSADWQARYGHPVLGVETFVDPAQFCGTVYTANGWQELGLTDGWGRRQRDYYVRHDQPKRLFVRERVKHARRSLQAQHLKPALAPVGKKAGARCYHKSHEIRAITEAFKALPDYRGRVRSPNGLWILGMLRRLVISLFMEWRPHQRKPHFQSLTDSQATMGEDNLAKALSFLTHLRPSL